MKEFEDVSGWAHLHGVAWRKTDETEAIFAKLHDTKGEVSEEEKSMIAMLAEEVVCTSLSADRIADRFPDMMGTRAETVAKLVRVHQIHRCTLKCHKSEVVGCWYYFPRLPSGLTLVASPPLSSMDDNVSKYLVSQCSIVQMEVRNVLKEVTTEGLHQTISLTALLHRVLGPVVETRDGFLWRGNIFPLIPDGVCHSVNWWRLKLVEAYDYPTREVLTVLAIYYTALATAITGEHKLVSIRHVSDIWVADFNPYCLEAMQSNMEVVLIMATPDRVLQYVTKANHRTT